MTQHIQLFIYNLRLLFTNFSHFLLLYIHNENVCQLYDIQRQHNKLLPQAINMNAEQKHLTWMKSLEEEEEEEIKPHTSTYNKNDYPHHLTYMPLLMPMGHHHCHSSKHSIVGFCSSSIYTSFWKKKKTSCILYNNNNNTTYALKCQPNHNNCTHINNKAIPSWSTNHSIVFIWKDFLVHLIYQDH